MVEEFILYKKYQDFIYYCYLLIDKIPKYEKSVIGYDIRKYLINNIELIIRICYERDKIIYLKKLDSNLVILSNLFRIVYKRKYISVNNYKAFSKKRSELGRIVGGYYKKY